jgi:hypothetical protein
MAAFNIEGVWEGEYTYRAGEGIPEPPSTVRFTLNARAGRFGRFSGVIHDDPVRGVPEPAAVTGRVTGRTVTFTKRYPTLFIYRQGRSVSLREYLETEHGRFVGAELPGAPILYEGTFDPATQSASGRWQLGPQRVRFPSGGQVLEVRSAGATGQWIMRRP